MVIGVNTMKFLTDEWCAEFEPKLKEVFSKENTPTKLTLTFCQAFGAVPQLDGKDFWYRYTFTDGVLTKLEKGNDMNDAPESEYKTFGDYDIAVKVMTGEMGEAKAVLGGKIKLKGNVTKALKMLDTYKHVQETMTLGGKTEW